MASGGRTRTGTPLAGQRARSSAREFPPRLPVLPPRAILASANCMPNQRFTAFLFRSFFGASKLLQFMRNRIALLRNLSHCQPVVQRFRGSECRHLTSLGQKEQHLRTASQSRVLGGARGDRLRQGHLLEEDSTQEVDLKCSPFFGQRVTQEFPGLLLVTVGA